MDADSESLCDLHRYAHIRISCNQRGIADGLITGQVNEVCYQEGVYLFLLPPLLIEPSLNLTSCMFASAR